MNKFILAVSLVALTTIASVSNAGIWDNISIAVGGHIEDAKSRFFGEDQVVSAAELLIGGEFDLTASGRDSVHWVNGSVKLVGIDGKVYVQLNKDFDTGNAPDLYIYASTTADINHERDFNNSTQYELGKLTRGTGASYYELITPDDVFFPDIKSVTIWCKQFGVYMGSADLKPIGATNE